MSAGDALRPVLEFFPGRSSRWVNESCRAGRIPRAVKIGRTWMVREADIEALVERRGRPTKTKITVADAAAELAKRGLS